MVCNRCVMVVKDLFEKHGMTPLSVTMGEVVVPDESVTPARMEGLDTDLASVGFGRIDDRKARLIEKLKNVIIRKIHHTDYADRKYNWSAVLSDELKYDYNYLSGLFSSVEGVTLEHYIIRQKIERVKELLFYDELSLNEIADRLGYSSAQHLSSQFRKVTGSTPSAYKKSHGGVEPRRSIDSV